jgi:putative hydrolase
VTDNLFDRLAELLQSAGPVNWKLAREIAESVAGQPEPIDPWVAEEYQELARTATLLVDESGPLDPATSTAAVNMVDRRGWATANVESFAYLGESLAGAFGGAGPLEGMLQPLGPALIGMQMGSMTGLMAHRVFGQFDVGLPAASGSGIFFVVPNIESFATDHGLEIRQTRLWIALQEVAHQAQFAIPWIREHYLALIREYLGNVRFDFEAMQQAMESIQDPSELEGMMSDPSALGGLVVDPEQQGTLEQIQAFMAVTEGSADWLVHRAAGDLIPDAPRLREAVDRRRVEPTQGEEALQKMLGLELKRSQYRTGAEFCAEVERRWGPETVHRLWEDSDSLPTATELEDVVGWAARVLL